MNLHNYRSPTRQNRNIQCVCHGGVDSVCGYHLLHSFAVWKGPGIARLTADVQDLLLPDQGPPLTCHVYALAHEVEPSRLK